jgi:hypothetical protein
MYSSWRREQHDQYGACDVCNLKARIARSVLEHVTCKIWTIGQYDQYKACDVKKSGDEDSTISMEHMMCSN